MLSVAPPVASLDLARAEALQVFAKGLAYQSRTVYSRPFGSSIRGPKQFRIQHDLDGFHTVEYTPQLGQQSIRRSADFRGGIESHPADEFWADGEKAIWERLHYRSGALATIRAATRPWDPGGWREGPEGTPPHRQPAPVRPWPAPALMGHAPSGRRAGSRPPA